MAQDHNQSATQRFIDWARGMILRLENAIAQQQQAEVRMHTAIHAIARINGIKPEDFIKAFQDHTANDQYLKDLAEAEGKINTEKEEKTKKAKKSKHA